MYIHVHALRLADVATMHRETEGPHPIRSKPRQKRMVRMQRTASWAQEISALVHTAVVDFITSPITLSSHHRRITTMRKRSANERMK